MKLLRVYFQEMLNHKDVDELLTKLGIQECADVMIGGPLLKGISGKPYYKACYKHYLSSNVRSNFAKVDSADWEIAIFLPLERFRKAKFIFKKYEKILDNF